MKRKLVRRGVGLLAAVGLTISLGALPAIADEPASFSMSVTSVRAGEATKLTEIDPCPAPTNDFQWDQYANVSFTDANGETSLWNVPIDEDGRWVSSIWMTPPHTRVLSTDPVVYSSSAALGIGSIQAWCEEDGVTTLEYETQTLTINGTSAAFKISSGFLKTGKPVHLESTTPCPPGSASMDGWMDVGTIGYYPFSAELDAGGSWSVDFTIPADFPTGTALIDAFCRPPGEPDSRMQVYTQSFALIEQGKFDYLAWGDSYAAGQSVEPFEAGTAEPGVNDCHRSVDAYPRLLERDPVLRLSLGDGFVACSGSKIEHVTGPNQNETAQWDQLSSDTDLVTITTSGNNVPFREFAFDCIAPHPGRETPCNGDAEYEAIAGIVNNVIPGMQSMLEALREKLNMLGSDAVILVVGYPYLVPETVPPDVPLGCNWLDPGELTIIRHVTETLNTAIRNEVDAIGGNFHFISVTERNSPFIGHELCRETADPNPMFFRDFELLAPQEYTAHPNGAGQGAYAAVVREWLMNNPLS